MQMQTEGVTAVHCNAQNVRPHAAILHVRGLDDITGSRVQRQAGAAAFTLRCLVHAVWTVKMSIFETTRKAWTRL